MRFRSSLAAGLVLICLICPFVELFDRWDHSAQTGSDTEYIFVVLALCVGAAYSFARAVLRISGSSQSNRAASTDGFLPTFFRGSFHLIVKASISASPPLTALRI